MISTKTRSLIRRESIGYLLVLAPILIYWLYWTFNPSYWFNADPAAFYFLDSLSIFAGGRYVYVDHPGTPVQVIGTLLLALTYPFLGGMESFINFYITRPEAFFLMTHVFLLASSMFTAIIFFNTAFTTLPRDRILGAIALTISYFALHPYTFPSLTFWSHNSFNFPFGTLLLLWLYRELRKEDEIKRTTLLLWGFAAGVLAIAQVYFFVWIASGVFTIFVYSLRSNQSLKQAVSSSLYTLLGITLGILAMLLPIYKELPRFADWLTKVVIHEEIYGTGDRGFFTWAMFVNGLDYLWTYLRPMMVVLLLVLLALGAFSYLRARSSLKVPASVFAMIAGLSLHTGLLLLMLIKTAGKLRYSLSLAAVLPILILLVLKLSEGTVWEKSKLTRIFYAVVFVGLVLTLREQIVDQQRRAFVEKDASLARSQAVIRLAKELGVSRHDLVIVYAYAVPIQCSGMLEASSWTGAFVEEVSTMCPNQYAIFDSVIELNTAGVVADIKEIDWDMVIWPGNGSNLPEYLESIGAVNVPKSWQVRRSRWFFIRPNDG